MSSLNVKKLLTTLKSKPKIILASTSPRRKELLTATGLKFKVIASHYREDLTLNLKPKKLVLTLAEGKALAVAKKYKNTIIIAADTIVVYQSQILGKPRSAKEAKQILQTLNGKSHLVFTGLTVIDTGKNKKVSCVTQAKVFFKKMPMVEINNYIKSKEPFGKAGAYASQGQGKILLKKIIGDPYTVVGLPLKTLAKILKDFDIT